MRKYLDMLIRSNKAEIINNLLMVKLTCLLLAALLALVAALPPQNPIIGVYTEDAEDFGQKI